MKQDFNIVLKWLSEGKKIRPKNRKLLLSTNKPIIKCEYVDGMYEYSDFTPTEYYFNKQFVEVSIDKSKQVKKVSICGIGSGKTYEVLYIYWNPQHNRTLCKLENGHITDYPFNLTDCMYYEFEVVEDYQMLPVKEITKKELELHFGRPLRIIE